MEFSQGAISRVVKKDTCFVVNRNLFRTENIPIIFIIIKGY